MFSGPAVTRPATAEDHTLHTTTTGNDTQPGVTTPAPGDGGVQQDESQTTVESATIVNTTEKAESQDGGGENMGQTTTESQPTDSATEGGENVGQTTTEYQPTDEATEKGGEEGEGESKGHTTTESQSADGATEGGGEGGVGDGGDGNSSTTATPPAVTTVTTQVPDVMTTTEMTPTSELHHSVSLLMTNVCVCVCVPYLTLISCSRRSQEDSHVH